MDGSQWPAAGRVYSKRRGTSARRCRACHRLGTAPTFGALSMADVEAFRQLVEARAGGACEYCRLLQAATGVTFHIEHLRPRSQGGLTVMANLVLSCPGCNLAKADRTTGEDQSGQSQPLFNPRQYDPWL